VAAAKAFRDRGKNAPKPAPQPLALPPHVAPSFFERAVSLVALFLRWKNRRRT
jgi:hypothetical protein